MGLKMITHASRYVRPPKRREGTRAKLTEMCGISTEKDDVENRRRPRADSRAQVRAGTPEIDVKSRIWVIDARAKIKHIGMRRRLKLWPVISLAPSSVHTHLPCACTVVRPPLFTRGSIHIISPPLIYYTTYLSRAHLLLALSRAHSLSLFRSGYLSPSLVRARTHTKKNRHGCGGGGGGVFHECTTRTCHVHTHTHSYTHIHTQTHTHIHSNTRRRPMEESVAGGECGYRIKKKRKKKIHDVHIIPTHA